MQPSEHQMQSAFFDWVDRMCVRDSLYESIAAIPNGGKRSAKTGAMLKAEGVRRGLLDVTVMVPRGKYHGLWMEFKKKPNVPSKEQRAWIDRLTKAGYLCCVVYSTIDAIKLVLWFFALGDFKLEN